MKVLWFTNNPMPAVNQRVGRPDEGSGFWMSALLEWLKARDDVRLGVATAAPGFSNAHFEEDRVAYFVVSQPRRLSIFAQRKRDIKRCVDIVSEWKPDLVHIHGSERFYGLLKSRKLIDVPMVISLQGLLGPCSQFSNFFGNLSPWQIVKSTRVLEFLAGLGLIWGYWNIRKGAKREAEIISAVNTFLGRTLWDRAYIYSKNPDAQYFHVGEILRSPFYEAIWSLSKCDRHSIMFTHAGHPRRGVETLLEAVGILRNEFPNINLRLAGKISQRSGYGRFLRRCIERSGLGHCISLLGYLDTERMADKLCKSHVFAISSHIENSPNSLCEAMLVGMPCVASYVGGIPSMIEEGRTGLFFPAGDAAVLASRIRQTFADDDLAVRLGSAARVEAMKRHLPEKVINQLLAAYRDVLSRHKTGTLIE